MALRLIVCCLLVGAPLLEAAELADWATLQAQLRQRPGPAILYFGSAANAFPRLAASAAWTAPLPVVVVPGSEPGLNPLTGRLVPGHRLHDLFEAQPGGILFLDEDGLPLPQLRLPWRAHHGAPELVALIADYVAEGHHRLMTLREYARAIGREQVLIAAAERLDPQSVGPGGWREVLDPAELPTLTDADTGASIDPWAMNGVFFVLLPAGSGSLLGPAQLTELWQGFRDLDPRICLVLPTGDEHDRLAGLVPADLAVLPATASAAALAELGPGPVVVCTAQVHGIPRGLRHDGFVSARQIAARLNLSLAAGVQGNRDVPVGALDPRPAPTGDAP